MHTVVYSARPHIVDSDDLYLSVRLTYAHTNDPLDRLWRFEICR